MSIVVKRLHGSRCHLVWTMEVRVGPDRIVLDGNPAAPKFRPVSIVAKAGWIKMPLGTEVGLSAGDIVLDDMYR